MRQLNRRIESAHAMESLGARLAAIIRPPLLITLRGPLAAGKTTLVRGLVHGFGIAGAVKSPTFTLVESYHLDALNIHHFDLYRLSDAEELEFIGIDDYFDERALLVVEWPERGERVLPAADVNIAITIKGESREVVLEGHSEAGIKLLFQIN